MTQPPSKVQQALSIALLRMLQSPNLSPDDAAWILQFALRMITEFSLAHGKNESAGTTESGLDMWVGQGICYRGL
jgi:hypothetical protein